MVDSSARTGTPDATNGNIIDITLVTNSSGTIVDRQTVAIGDPTTIARAAVLTTGASASTNDAALVVTMSPNAATHKVAQGAAGASAWLISGPVTLVNTQVTIAQAVTLATGAATIGAVTIATGAAVIGALATGSATIGVLGATTATIGQVVLATGAAVVGALATGTATIGAVTIATGAAAIGSLATGSATIGQVALVTGAAVIGALATGTATIGQVQVVGAARTNIAITFASITGITTEALATLQINKAGTLSSGTTYTVTTGKTLRVQSVNGHIVTTGATGQSAKITVRNAAAVTVASPGYAVLFISAPAAVAAAGAQLGLPIPDGLEFASATQLGVSHLETTANDTVNFALVGYEY